MKKLPGYDVLNNIKFQHRAKTENESPNLPISKMYITSGRVGFYSIKIQRPRCLGGTSAIENPWEAYALTYDYKTGDKIYTGQNMADDFDGENGTLEIRRPGHYRIITQGEGVFKEIIQKYDDSVEIKLEGKGFA